ncbi:coth protein-domain-containing protein [Neocallimastix sp. 'constans']|jgi:hypothetical protein
MLFNKTINILLLSFTTILVNAEKVKFKVLAVNGTPVLNINGAQQPMTAAEYPLYEAEVDVDNFPVTYNYSIDNEVEPFNRQRNKDDKSLNEFFGREITFLEHPLLPRAYNAFELAKNSKLFDDRIIGNFIVTTDGLQELYDNIDDQEFKVPAKVIYASPFTIKTFNNAELSIGGQSTRFVPKLSFKIKGLKDENNKELYGRSTVKLRAEHMDSSFLRDKLYCDLLNSLGVPAAQNAFARLYINGQALGFYSVSDSISSDHYLRDTFNNGEKFSQVNPLFKADFCPTCEIGVSYGDLGYYGDDPNHAMYAIYTYKGEDKDTVVGTTKIAEHILPLVKQIDDYKNNLTNEFPLDADTFSKYMVMEFLSGAIDNYWNKPGNYYLFKDAAKDKWYFHDSDFHYTFGCGGNPEDMMNTPLAQYPPLLEENVKKDRAPLDGYRAHHDAEFLKIFDRLIKTAYNPSAIYPRLDSLAKLVKEDAYWDFTLPKTNPKPTADQNLVYTNEDFDIQALSEAATDNFSNIPIRTFINTRLNNVAQELGIQIPTNPETDLGYVENPKADVSSGNSSSSAIGQYSWSIISTILVILFSIIF